MGKNKPHVFQNPINNYLCPVKYWSNIVKRGMSVLYYWCPVKFWYNTVKRRMVVLYKAWEYARLTFAHCTVGYLLPLKGAHIIG